MKVPRVSVLALMAVVLVIALDGAAFRLIGARPDYLSAPVFYTALMVMPMANVLAVAASLRSRRTGSARAFLVGFEVAGWAAAAASTRWYQPISTLGVGGLAALLGEDLIGWMEAAVGQQFVYNVGFAAAFLVVQVSLATVAGLAARWAWRRGHTGRDGDGDPRPSRLVPLAWLVLVVAVPVAAIEGYLRVAVDPQLRAPAIARLAEGSAAIVDVREFGGVMRFYERSGWDSGIPANSPFLAADGARVRVDSDSSAWRIEHFIVPSTGQVWPLRDLRMVRCTVMDGDRRGESVGVPRFVLRPRP